VLHLLSSVLLMRLYRVEVLNGWWIGCFNFAAFENPRHSCSPMPLVCVRGVRWRRIRVEQMLAVAVSPGPQAVA
jgi:hypothetical protein